MALELFKHWAYTQSLRTSSRRQQGVQRFSVRRTEDASSSASIFSHKLASNDALATPPEVTVRKFG